MGVTGDWRGGDGRVFATRMLPPSSGEELRSAFMTATHSIRVREASDDGERGYRRRSKQAGKQDKSMAGDYERAESRQV